MTLAPASPAAGRPGAAALALLVALTALTYLNADHEEFFFDSRHGDIRVADPAAALRADLRSLMLQWWRPGEDLSRITFRLNALVQKLAGMEPFDVTGYLAVNVLLHAFNAWLVMQLIGRLRRAAPASGQVSRWPAFLCAAVFALHPLQAGSVAYIIQRRGILATTFFLLAALCYLVAREAPAAAGSGPRRDRSGRSAGAWPVRRIVAAAGVVLCYWLGAKSKYLALPLPFALLAIEFCLRAPDPVLRRRFLKVLVPATLLAAAAMFAFAWSKGVFDPARGEIEAYTPGVDWTAWQHLLTQSRVFVHYWKLLLFPWPGWMSVDHRIEVSRHLLHHGAWAAMMLHALLLAGAVFLAIRGRRLASAGLLWFYVGLIPYALLPHSELFVEYKTYLPAVGLVTLLAEGMTVLEPRLGELRVRAAVAVMAAALMLVTVSRNRIYQDPLNLWLDAVSKYPDDPRINLSIGYTLARRGRVEEAEPYYRKALQAAPEVGDVQYFFANFLRRTGRCDQALPHYRRALTLSLQTPPFRVRHHLGICLSALGQAAEAVETIGSALAECPQDEPLRAVIHYDLGNALVGAGRQSEAVDQYRAALERRPAWPEALTNLANALLETGRTGEAIDNYRRSLETRPDDVNTLLGMAAALQLRGQLAEAERLCRRAVELAPANPHARDLLESLTARRP